MNAPGRSIKLEDCKVHGPGSGAELFVVEGDSASIAVNRVKDTRFQAVLPMQGKPLNTLKASAGKVTANRFFMALTEAIGTGWGGAFDASAMRYDRIVLLMDPDADGIHCGALLLMFFYRWMQPLLDGGHLEMAHPPVGEITPGGTDQPQFVYTDAQFQSLSAQMRERENPAFTARRYRGLAGMNPAALEALCVNSATRHSRPLSAANAESAIEVFASLRSLPPQRPLF